MHEILLMMRDILRDEYNETQFGDPYTLSASPGFKGVCFVDLIDPNGSVVKELDFKKIPSHYDIVIPQPLRIFENEDASLGIPVIRYYPTNSWVKAGLDFSLLCEVGIGDEYRSVISDIHSNVIHCYYMTFRRVGKDGKILRNS